MGVRALLRFYDQGPSSAVSAHVAVRGEGGNRSGTVRVCDPEPVRDGYGGSYDGYRTGNANAYDVTYEYNGRQYTRRMDYHPGDRVRVRVDVSPE